MKIYMIFAHYVPALNVSQPSRKISEDFTSFIV